MALSETAAQLKTVVEVLKRHYTNLSVIESIDLAQEILEALETLRIKGPAQGPG